MKGESAVHALRGLDLTVEHGELLVLLGPSGSGKSTLLNILGGLDRPTSGHARFRDLDLVGAGDAEITQYRRHHVGFVFQFYNLIASLTAEENVELVTEIADRPMSALEALDLVGLAPRRHHFPAQLSGGEQQRVADRPRHCEAPDRAALRRADRCARCRDRHPRARVDRGRQCAARHDDPADHPQRRHRPHRRPGRPLRGWADPLRSTPTRSGSCPRSCTGDPHRAAFDRKLVRDLSRLWLQIIAVGAVLGCGIGLYVMATGMCGSLERARDDYYARARMADLAASVVRAPLRVAGELEAIPGVDAIETRISGVGLVDLPGVTEPVSAQLVSLPLDRPLRVNDLVLREGRLPAPLRDAEIVVNEAFAAAHDLRPGSRLTALIYGKRRALEVVGIGGSPEFVFAVAPGELLPEPKRFGVFWMGREALARAFDLDGAFNDVVLRLARDADQRAVIDGVDRVLARHGGRGAYGRDRMLSAQFLKDELASLRTMASVLPPVFLLVAVFLVNVALSRLVATERSNIGLLKGLRLWQCGRRMAPAVLRRVRVGRRAPGSCRRPLGWPVHGFGVPHGLQPARAGFRRRPRRPCRCFGRRPAGGDRGCRAGRPQGRAAAACGGTCSAGANGLRPTRCPCRAGRAPARCEDADDRPANRALPAPLDDNGARSVLRTGAAGRFAALSRSHLPHRRGELRHRAAHGCQRHVLGSGRRAHPA
ncbi:MAG: ATP-binding cassette domain-containing protein [Steroidobacteraceae bacterium]